MKAAGRAVGASLLRDYLEFAPWPTKPRILVLAGKGHNTGDALVACNRLGEELPGLHVTLLLTTGRENWSELTAACGKELEAALGDRLDTISLGEWKNDEGTAGDFHVVIDGLYGLGFKPPLQDAIADLFDGFRDREEVPVRVAVDVPSGVGEETSPQAFPADLTYIPGVAKEALFRPEAFAFAGRCRFLEIDPFRSQPVDASAQPLELCAPQAYRGLNRLRPARSDKRTFGHAIVLAGSLQMPGAALMATKAALQAGAGLVTTLTPGTLAPQIAGHAPEAMWRPLHLSKDGGLDVDAVRILAKLAGQAHSLLIGPGLILDRSTLFTICRIVREIQLPLVLDASALTQDVMTAVLARSASAGPVVVTPHEGEFLRMNAFKEDAARRDNVSTYSERYRCTVVLKGHPTLIAKARRTAIAPYGGPLLARGGTGDLLSGILVTLLGQQPENGFDAAVKAVTWHAAAGDALARERGSCAVTTMEILPYLSPVLRDGVAW
ncbi:MAG: NAD(P)H-hydrate dehydratase [Verrucomicrobia bacterium]|nr:NAD(P)H-hydrate dehydratase [Verrucomicrobiota bacterium]